MAQSESHQKKQNLFKISLITLVAWLGVWLVLVATNVIASLPTQDPQDLPQSMRAEFIEKLHRSELAEAIWTWVFYALVVAVIIFGIKQLATPRKR